MEQLRHLVVVFVFVVFLISCQRDNESVEHYKKFTENGIPKRKDIKSKKLYFPEVITPLKIIVKDDYLVLSESRRISSEKPLLHIIDLKRGEYVQGKGVVGFGPGEIPDVFHLEEGLNPKTFWVASGMGKTFSEFSLDDSSKYANRQIKQEEEFYMASQYSLASDSTVVCRMVNDPHQFVEIDIKGGRISSFGNWDNYSLGKDLTDYMMSDLNKGWLDANPSKNIFVSVGIYRDRIELLKKDQNKIITIDGPKLDVPKFDIVSGKGSSSSLVVDYDEPLSYLDVSVGNEYFYALYCNKNEREIQESGEYGNSVFVFDFDGNVKLAFKLDRSVKAIAVDKNEKILYGITTDRDPGIAEFVLP